MNRFMRTVQALKYHRYLKLRDKAIANSQEFKDDPEKFNYWVMKTRYYIQKCIDTRPY